MHDFHKNEENYFLAKLNLFKNLSKDSTALLNIDDKYFNRIIQNIKCNHLTYGFNNKADIFVKNYNLQFDLTTAEIVYKNNKFLIVSKLYS